MQAAGLPPEDRELVDGVISGQRRALAKAITLIESTRHDHQERAAAVLDALLPHTGRALRIGLTGVPGVGKSTFIEAFGLHLIAQGLKVAVLAIDPSSSRSGGSILGDKTRMERLSREPNAFIRPSPSAGELGGVARRTRETILAVEAAGFDPVLVETVGVGQSETAVADMTDMFVLLHAPGGGDELQGVKRGIMELADMIVVNKADGDLLPAARRARADLKGALHLMRPKHPGWVVPVLLASALEAKGVDEVWERIGAFMTILGEGGRAEMRRDQARAWMWADIRDGLLQAFAGDEDIARETRRLEADVVAGRMTPPKAAQSLLKAFLKP